MHRPVVHASGVCAINMQEGSLALAYGVGPTYSTRPWLTKSS